MTKVTIGLRSFFFGLFAVLAAESVLVVLIFRVHDPALITALAPIFAGFFGVLGTVVAAVIVKHSVESLATGGGIGGAWKALTTSTPPGAQPPPATPPAGGTP